MLRLALIAFLAVPPAAAAAPGVPVCCTGTEAPTRGPARVWFRSESPQRQAVAVSRGRAAAPPFLPAAGLAAGTGDGCGPPL